MQSGAGGPAGAAGANGGWKQVETGFTWADLVLPESQEALLKSTSATLQSGGRLRLLFTGGPGTGKTMACQILGARSDAPVLSLDVSGKDAVETGAAEELLRAAGRVGAVVVVDHADLLLRGRRESRHSAESLDGAALLARARAHAGAVVFTSTSTRAVKDELLAQFDCVVAFPFPDRRARKGIWRRLLPDDSRLTDADLELVADSFQLPGAAIRECCTLATLAAEAQAARVTLAHVARALELEYGHRLAGDSTFAALDELRRRAGGEEEADLAPAPVEPAEARSRLPRPSLSMPRQPTVQAPATARASRRVLRPVLIVLTTLLMAGLGFLIGRATGSERLRPAVAKRVFTEAAPAAAEGAATTPTAPTTGQPASAGAPGTSYANALDGVIFPLHRTRSVLFARLRKTPSWSAAAAEAEQLASAYTTAAMRLRAADAGSAAAANAALAAAFTQTAAAFSAFRRAELDRSHSERVSAMAALRRANAAGAAAYAELRRAGYRVPVALRSSG